jgi:dTDP-4-amino-4,6-dideoxygalactose transaminase
LRAAGVRKGGAVLCNAFTLSPVPGAIHNAGGEPVLVATNSEYKIDTVDSRAKAVSSGARLLLLSHMRGHIADMDAVVQICDELDIVLIEDCAHTLGARRKGRPSGFLAGCVF